VRMTRAAPIVLSATILIGGCAGHGTAPERSLKSARPVLQSASIERGRAVFETQCTACHGSDGAGGQIGPSLRNERTRKDPAAAIAWIKNPEPPMPKLYPAELSDQDLIDVAAYVESL
jgi:mono/diheme cytochrome c family protein